jgi:hypothetical protein
VSRASVDQMCRSAGHQADPLSTGRVAVSRGPRSRSFAGHRAARPGANGSPRQDRTRSPRQGRTRIGDRRSGAIRPTSRYDRGRIDPDPRGRLYPDRVSHRSRALPIELTSEQGCRDRVPIKTIALECILSLDQRNCIQNMSMINSAQSIDRQPSSGY